MKKLKCRGVEQIFREAELKKVKEKRIKLDNIKLNQFFGKGLLRSCVTEIVGRNGCGKTQFALTLCAEQLLHIAQKVKNNSNSKKTNTNTNTNINININRNEIILYIYVNRDFPIHRLVQILKHKLITLKNEKGITAFSSTENSINKNGKENRSETDIESVKEENLVDTVNEQVDKNVHKHVHENVDKKIDEKVDENVDKKVDEEVDENVEVTEKEKTKKIVKEPDVENNIRPLLQNLFIKKITDEQELFFFFEKQIFEIFKYYSIPVLIVDSVNTIFNSIKYLENYKKNQLIMKLSLLLNNISYTHDCLVLLLNSSYMKSDKDDSPTVFHEDTVIPSFSNTVIVFKKYMKNKEVVQRTMYVQYSQYINSFQFSDFLISEKGFEII